MSEEVKTYTGGAMRSGEILPYGDIPAEALDLLAEAFLEGREKYEKKYYPWEKNYQTGNKKFMFDAMNHLQKHFIGFNQLVRDRMKQVQRGKDPRSFVNTWEGDDIRTHLSHLLANAAMLAWFLENGCFDSMDGAEFNDGTKPEEEPEEFPENIFANSVEPAPASALDRVTSSIADFFRRQ